jgi:hypothetical protein
VPNCVKFKELVFMILANFNASASKMIVFVGCIHIFYLNIYIYIYIYIWSLNVFRILRSR